MQHSQAGIWVMGLLDIFPCGAVQMYWLLIFQTIAIAWVLGGGRWVQRDKKSFPLQRLWNSVRFVTGVKNLRYFWIAATMIVAPLAILVILMSIHLLIISQAGFLVTSIQQSGFSAGNKVTDIVGNTLQSFCNVWLVGGLIHTDLNGFRNIPKNY